MASVTFNYDPKESLGGDYLIPVYFNKHVLVKYLYDPRFSVQFASETYGTVYLPDIQISFGINSTGAIIAWLGDLKELPYADQIHWFSENVEPQRDIKSEFFDAQVNVNFTERPIGIQAINAIDNWNTAFARKYGVQLYKPKSFENRLEDVRRYRRMIIQSEDDFMRFVSELNEIINENVDTTAIKKFLSSKSIDVPTGLKGNKLVELVYKRILGDTTNIIEPFFLLYDLRLWADHNINDTVLREVASKLGVSNLADFEGLLTALLIRLRDTAENLKKVYG